MSDNVEDCVQFQDSPTSVEIQKGIIVRSV